MADYPPNTIIISGEQGINELLAMVYDAWDKDVDYRLVFHLDENHPAGVDMNELAPYDACPKIVFTQLPIKGASG